MSQDKTWLSLIIHVNARGVQVKINFISISLEFEINNSPRSILALFQILLGVRRRSCLQLWWLSIPLTSTLRSVIWPWCMASLLAVADINLLSKILHELVGRNFELTYLYFILDNKRPLEYSRKLSIKNNSNDEYK